MKAIKQWLKDFVHNVIVHPAMMFLPADLGDKMHNKNAEWAFGRYEGPTELDYENKKIQSDVTD